MKEKVMDLLGLKTKTKPLYLWRVKYEDEDHTWWSIWRSGTAIIAYTFDEAVIKAKALKPGTEIERLTRDEIVEEPLNKDDLEVK